MPACPKASAPTTLGLALALVSSRVAASPPVAPKQPTTPRGASDRDTQQPTEPGERSTQPRESSTPGASPRTGETTPRTGEALTLGEILEYALAGAPDVQVAQAMVSLGIAEQLAAKPLLPANPVVTVGVGARSNPRGRNVEVQAQLMQPLWIAGQRRLRRKAATAQRQRLTQRLEQQRWETYVELHAAYNRALLAKQRWQALLELQAFSRAVARLAEVQVKAGEISRLKLELAEAAVAEAEQAVLAAAQRYRWAAIDLARMAGWPEDRRIEPVDPLPAPARVEDVEPVVRAAVRRHPQIVTAEAAVAAARATLAAEDRAAWPNPSVGVFVLREDPPEGNVSSTVALGMLSIPIPAWQRNQGDRARAHARLRVARTELQTTRQQLVRRVRQNADAVNTAAARIELFTREVIPRFAENLRLLQRAYELGETDLLELFVARERFVDLQQQALDIYEDYFAAVRAFERASGQSLAVPAMDVDGPVASQADTG